MSPATTGPQVKRGQWAASGQWANCRRYIFKIYGIKNENENEKKERRKENDRRYIWYLLLLKTVGGQLSVLVLLTMYGIVFVCRWMGGEEGACASTYACECVLVLVCVCVCVCVSVCVCAVSYTHLTLPTMPDV